MENQPFQNDLLSRKEFADRLFTFLSVERQFVDDALVVTLQAPFGSGKTYFFQNWMLELSNRRKTDSNSPRPILLNAWETDYCGDPLLALILAIYRELGGDKKNEKALKKIKEAAKDIFNFGIGIANSLVVTHTGIDPIAAEQYAEGKKEKRQAQENLIPDVLASLERKEKAFATIKNALKSLFEGETLKAIIMVDELDRCRPDYAISYLETIKHIFDIPGMAFILAIDHSQLQSTAKSLFGNDLDFDEYLRKFVQRRIELPEIDAESGMLKLINYYIDKYILDDKRLSKFPQNGWEHIRELFPLTRPNFRQAQEIFRIIGHIFSSNENKNSSIYWCWAASAIMLSVLFVTRPDSFRKINKNTIGFQDACGIFLEIIMNVNNRHKRWWMMVFATGHYTNSKNENNGTDSICETLKQLKCLDKELALIEWQREASPFHQGWGHRYFDRSSIQTICSYIEMIERISP